MDKEYLNECFALVDGVLFWKERPRSHFKTERGFNTFNAQKAGRVAGCNSLHGDALYSKVRLNKKLYLGHRLVWIMHHGEIPEGMEIDHIDHNGINNKIDNLRLVDSCGNKTNRTMVSSNTSGCMGVYLNKKINKWIAEIVVNKQYYGLGSYVNKADAVAARKEAEVHFKFHENHGGAKIDYGIN